MTRKTEFSWIALLLTLQWVVVHCTDSSTSASVADSSASPSPTVEQAPISDHRFFLQEIFNKYGHDGMMTLEGFEHLLENLKLGNVIIQDHDLTSHKEEHAFISIHDSHEHKKGRDSTYGKTTSNRGERASNTRIELPMPNQPSRSARISNAHGHTHHSHDSHSHHSHSPSGQGASTHSHHEPHGSSDHDHDHHSGDEEHQHDTDSHEKPIPELLTNITELVDKHVEVPRKRPEKPANQLCLSPLEILATFDINPENSLSPISFLHLCPAIIYELDQQNCLDGHDHQTKSHSISTNQWLYSSLAVLMISLCGLFSVAVIPIMQKWFYHTLLQFLVGLAVGSLSGDAMLHLLPHAMLGEEDEHDNHREDVTQEVEAVWRGMTALGGIYFFFIAERLLNALTMYRKQKKAKLYQLPQPSRLVHTHDHDDLDPDGMVGEKLSHYRKNSYGLKIGPDGKENIQMLQNQDEKGSRAASRQSSVHEVGFHGRSSFSADPVSGALYLPAVNDPNSDAYVVTVSDHHGHGHGHSHEVPQSVSAVAWMVIMGDGLHNFCDGMAIGTAFASGIAGGISTTVAVFCHELPHELGDFAMLLKTGMKVKQALLYNCLSSVLCLIGMVIGVSLGSVSSTTSWIFAGTAGMFMYIALVDMLPELATPSEDPRSTPTYTLAVQFLGISTGVSVMLLIAIYEHDLKTIVS